MEIIRIDSLNEEQLLPYSSANERQLRHYNEPNVGYFVAESPKVIERAIKAGYMPVSALVDIDHITPETREVLSLLGNTAVYGGPDSLLTELTGYHLTRGMQCLMKRKPLPSIEALCEKATRITVLEEVVNPTNIGAIFRNAAAMNMDAVILTEGCSDPLYRRSARVSMGTVFQIDWTYIENWKTSGLKQLKDYGFTTVAMALRNDTVSIDDEKLNSAEKIAIILGSEGDGLAEETISGCDYTVKIPMKEVVDSLNVASASAIAFWQLTSDKRKKR